MENGQKPREAGQQEPQQWPGQDAAVRTAWTRLPCCHGSQYHLLLVGVPFQVSRLAVCKSWASSGECLEPVWIL